MSMTIEERNAMLRRAVKARHEAQARGEPLEEWYEGVADSQIAADMAHDATRLTDEQLQQQIHDHHLHRAGLSQDELDEALERLRGDGLLQTGVHPTSQAFFDLCDGLKEMHRKKSRDYGCPSGTDPLANIRNGAKFVGIPAWRAAMVRLSDKVTRLATFNATGHLHNEGVIDTLEDLASYSLLALLLYREENGA